MGFSGDTDDLDEDDIEQDMAGDDDWMFQTFQKTAKAKAARARQNDTLMPLPQENQDSSEDLQQLEIEEDERAIPIENMGLLGSLLSDRALDFTK